MLGTIRYVRKNLAVCGFVGIRGRDEFAGHGFHGHLQCAEPFDSWIDEVCDVLAVPFLDGLPIPRRAFERAREWFLPKWMRGENVLISCAGGSSRSVSMASGLLAIAESGRFELTAKEVLTAIPGAYPHPLTLCSAAHFSGASLDIGQLREIYAAIEHRPPYPWPDDLLQTAATFSFET